MRGSWRPNRNFNILTPLLWPSALCLSCSPDAQPEAQRPTLLGDSFLYCILSANSLDPFSMGAPSPFGLVWLSLPHLVYKSVRSLTATLTSVLTELYNSSTSTQSPTRSLEWHEWSSSSGNNCHAVHRSLSSGASVCECTIGIFFTSPHFISRFPPTRFPLITAIRMCHFLPVHHSEWHFWSGRRSKYHISTCMFTGLNDKIVALKKTAWFHFRLMKTGFHFLLQSIYQFCKNPKSDRSLLSCLKVTQCLTSEIGDAPLYNSCSLPI